MTVDSGNSWSGAFTFSPKVVIPFLAGLIGFAVTWVTTGNFDGPALAVLIASLGYAVIGVVAPPAPGVKQREVEALRRGK